MNNPMRDELEKEAVWGTALAHFKDPEEGKRACRAIGASIKKQLQSTAEQCGGTPGRASCICL